MLKLGKMYSADGEYNIFILENESISRLEIGTPTSMWQCINSNILYGEYTKERYKTYGNTRIGKLYKDTLRNAKTIEAPEQIDLWWEDGEYYKNTLKYVSDYEYYSHTEKMGKLYSEIYFYGGVNIEIFVFDETYNLDLEPLNYLEYRGVKRPKRIPKQTERQINKDEYENCLYLAGLFKALLKSHLHSYVDMNSPAVLRTLFNKMEWPVMDKDNKGISHAESEMLRKLAVIKNEFPSIIAKSDITDKNGRLVLKAEDINSIKYPEAVFLEKYHYYMEQAKSLRT